MKARQLSLNFFRPAPLAFKQHAPVKRRPSHRYPSGSAEEFEKESLVDTLTSQVTQKRTLIAGYTSDLSKLVVKGTEAQAGRHAELSQMAQAAQRKGTAVLQATPRLSDDAG